MSTQDNSAKVAAPRPPFSAVLLAVLFGVALFALGEKIYRDVRDVPTRPRRDLVAHDPALVAIESIRKATRDSLSVLTDSLRACGQRSRELEVEYTTHQDAYRTLLEYRAAHGVSAERLSPGDRASERDARVTMDALRTRWDAARTQQKTLEVTGDAVRARFQRLDGNYRDRQSALERDFAVALRRYEGQVTLLRLLVVIPLLLAMVFIFQRTRVRGSMYEVHATAGLVVSVTLILRASAEYAWKAAHYYGALVLTVVVLGVLLRAILRQHRRSDRLVRLRVSRGECPTCGLTLVATAAAVPAMAFCSRCGTPTRHACASCGKPASAFLPYCPECGKRSRGTVDGV